MVVVEEGVWGFDRGRTCQANFTSVYGVAVRTVRRLLVVLLPFSSRSGDLTSLTSSSTADTVFDRLCLVVVVVELVPPNPAPLEHEQTPR
jgi:hypothetical protein